MVLIGKQASKILYSEPQVYRRCGIPCHGRQSPREPDEDTQRQKHRCGGGDCAVELVGAIVVLMVNVVTVAAVADILGSSLGYVRVQSAWC